MSYEIRRLELFKDLLYLPAGENAPPAGFTGERLTRFETDVDRRNLEPRPEEYLRRGVFCGYGLPSNTDGSLDSAAPDGVDARRLERIPAGTYAFVQGEAAATDAHEKIMAAAEELWLECLWEEWEPTDSTVYLREIPHGSTTVFQLFRRLSC